MCQEGVDKHNVSGMHNMWVGVQGFLCYN
ncbi:hypothetical protein MACK_003801 [Theileria orientalis]|uniref:Uncharacterized protein n=1 Tax=Theileria orientalis TaxID=68886 RepID=A0A976SIX3_THEOR|nr:hypothetical protein MACK_003801 [Theileria orientalis]